MGPGTKLLLGIAAGVAFVWYNWAMTHVFLNTGTNNKAQDLSLNQQVGMIMGVSLLGSFVVAVALIVLSFQWVNIWYKAIIGIMFAFVALSMSTMAMSIASITH